MTFKPGQGGRPKGIPNKLTSTLRSAIESAFDEVGGKAYLVRIAESDPRTFLALLGRVLPLQVVTPDDKPVVIRVITGVSRSPELESTREYE
jgi:hypothetical protein